MKILINWKMKEVRTDSNI